MIIRTRTELWITAALVIGLVLSLAFFVLAESLGRFLVVADALAPSDVILVLSGGTPARELQAAALYHRGLARRIVVSLPRDPLSEVSRRLSGEASLQDRAVAVLQHVYVPAAAITKMDSEVQNSEEELQAFFKWARMHGLQRVILVTSPYHTRRLRVMWDRRYQNLLPAAIYPTTYEPFDPNRWWRSRRDLELSIHEVAGLVHFMVGSPLPTNASSK